MDDYWQPDLTKPGHWKCVVTKDGQVCGHTLPRRHITRMIAHYTGTDPHIKQCENITQQEIDNFLDKDIKDDNFVEMESGYTRYKTSQINPHLQFYAHDADKINVQCLWCDMRMVYNNAQMKEHFHSICPKFPDSLRFELFSWSETKIDKLTKILRTYIHRVVQEKGRDAAEAWYHSSATQDLLTGLATLPRIPNYHKQPFSVLIADANHAFIPPAQPSGSAFRSAGVKDANRRIDTGPPRHSNGAQDAHQRSAKRTRLADYQPPG